MSFVTALAFSLTLLPAPALAAGAADDPGGGLCPHHKEHTPECGYAAPAEGRPCGHVHTAACYTLGELPGLETEPGEGAEPGTADAPNAEDALDAEDAPNTEGALNTENAPNAEGDSGADAENRLDCPHEHDEACGYAAGDPGRICEYECRVCPIEALLDALPAAEDVTADNADEVREQLQEILTQYRELTWEEQEQLDVSPCRELQAALDASNVPAPTAGAVSYVDASGATLKSPDSCAALTAEMAGKEQPSGWYVASGNVNAGTNGFTFADGDTNLILEDGCSLTGAIYAKGNLTIYAQTRGSGSLTAQRGSGEYALNSDAAITINGGRITATGGVCAAIGGVSGHAGTVVINGGTVNASTSGHSQCGAAIGGGAGASGTVTINGGTVNANSSIGAGVSTETDTASKRSESARRPLRAAAAR